MIGVVTLAELKSHCRIDSEAEDAYLTHLIDAAQTFIENDTSRRFITQTAQVSLDAWPAATGAMPWWDGQAQGAIGTFTQSTSLRLPIAPVQSVTSVTLLDEDGAGTAFTGFYLDKADGYGEIILKKGVAWPTPFRDKGGIIIDFVVGYGVDGTTAPSDLKHAVLLLAAHWYETREGVTPSMAKGMEPKAVPFGVQAILNKYRRLRLL
jgi:uncharacterized phiE125 gp8 family phage protein